MVDVVPGKCISWAFRNGGYIRVCTTQQDGERGIAAVLRIFRQRANAENVGRRNQQLAAYLREIGVVVVMASAPSEAASDIKATARPWPAPRSGGGKT